MVYFSTSLDAVRTARDPFGKGKPWDRNTYMRLVGTFQEPQCLILRFHRTDIARFYPDGSREIHDGWTSNTTLARLRDYANVYVSQRYLVSVNGYRPHSERAYFISTGSYGQVVPFHAAADYIRINSDNQFDMSTVKPWSTRCITHPKELRRAMRHLSKCAGLLRGYAKLANDERCFEDGAIPLDDWLLKQVNVQLEDVKLDPRPSIYVGPNGSLKTAIAHTFDGIRWAIAQEKGWTGPCEIMECR